MAYNNLQILNFNHNIVSLSNGNTLVITDNIKGNSITIPEPITHILQINSPGPQGPVGPSGSEGGGAGLSGGTDTYIPLWSGSNALTSSFLNQSGSILKTVNQGNDIGLKLDFTSNQFAINFGGEAIGQSSGLNMNTNSDFYSLGKSGYDADPFGLIITPSEIRLGDFGGNVWSYRRGINIGRDYFLTYNDNGTDVGDRGIKLDFANKKYQLGDYGNIDNTTKIIVDDENQTVNITGSLNITGTTNIRPYKVYTATLYQYDINDPTVTILENTLDFDITWTRTGIGQYIGTFSVEQVDRSKWFVMTGFQNPGSAPQAGKINVVDFYDSAIIIITVNDDIPPIFSDGVLFQTPIEIRVYN